jgi:hypothetical protein
MIQASSLRGLVRRRVLVNFHVDPDIMQRHLPEPFRPTLVGGRAIAGVCLIRLEQIRPAGFPASLGLSSENAAHRVAVTWTDERGEPRDGVYIPRRDTGSCFNALVGGRVFPGEQRHARFRVRDDSRGLDLRLETRDGLGDVWLRARPGADLPPSSVFASLEDASDFFAGGSVGYSATQDAGRLDGLRMRIGQWHVEPLDLDWLVSSYYADRARFPTGSVEYDCTLIMRDLPHRWDAVPGLPTTSVRPFRAAASTVAGDVRRGA